VSIGDAILQLDSIVGIEKAPSTDGNEKIGLQLSVLSLDQLDMSSFDLQQLPCLSEAA
jgi:hypothetical protein